MIPYYLPNGKVQVRYIARSVSMEDYDNHYQYQSAYKILKREGTVRHPSYVLMARIPNSKEFETRYLQKNGSYRCQLCNDRGVVDTNDGYKPCTCEWGQIVDKLTKE